MFLKSRPFNHLKTSCWQEKIIFPAEELDTGGSERESGVFPVKFKNFNSSAFLETLYMEIEGYRDIDIFPGLDTNNMETGKTVDRSGCHKHIR